MKKSWLITVTLALSLLSACGAKPDSSKSSTSSSTEKTSQTSKKSSSSQASEKSSSSSSSSESKSSSTSSSTLASSSSSKPAINPTVNRLAALNAQLKAALPGALLPTVYPLHAQILNASYSGNAANYQIYYAVNAHVLPFNTQAVNQNAAAVALTKTTYATPAAAEAQINYQAPEVGLPKVPVGDGLSATQQGAAGSNYTGWQEGRWSLTVQAINQFNEDGLALTKQAVALLSQKMLPIPEQHGAVMLRVNTGGLRLNTVSWRRGNVLYTANGVDAMDLLQIVTSLK